MLLFIDVGLVANFQIFVISKHLMLLFILRAVGCRRCTPQFQNILRYCLSIMADFRFKDLTVFQNILCYCLSERGKLVRMCKEVFQNILCYCLSFWRYEPCRRKRISKHLMLLFIMYRRPFPATAVCISKHLMLLFIYLAISGIVEFLKFQNILCYCLSISTAECRTNRIISKHLMLLFIVMQHRKRDQ